MNFIIDLNYSELNLINLFINTTKKRKFLYRYLLLIRILPKRKYDKKSIGDRMPIMEGWEVSPDRLEKFEKMIGSDPIGDPIITSKCRLGRDNGLLVASDTGFAWRIQTGFSTSMYSMGKSKWVRWHDVDRIDLKKEGFILLYLKVREKNGPVKLDGKGNPKLKKWAFSLNKNKNEEKTHYLQRRSAFFPVISDIFNKNKGDTDPPTSDSRI